METVVLRGAGNSSVKVCKVAELLRHGVEGLHKEMKISSIEVESDNRRGGRRNNRRGDDEEEDKEDEEPRKRILVILEVTLSLNVDLLDTSSIGYQAPPPSEEVEVKTLDELMNPPRTERTGGDDRRRGGYNNNRR